MRAFSYEKPADPAAATAQETSSDAPKPVVLPEETWKAIA